jgi:hypothetical protein
MEDQPVEAVLDQELMPEDQARQDKVIMVDKVLMVADMLLAAVAVQVL